mgnify:CR=1 FL=1|tara:strand:- start:6620 stop:7093 length:474 start_codon:yes stop_codon:yes gene_type:complete
MAITPDFKNYSLFRTFRQHPITEVAHFVSTSEWSDNANATYNGTGNSRVYELENPISFIKATAEVAAHDSAITQPYYSQRVTVIVGTMDEKVAGSRYDATHRPLGWADVTIATSGAKKCYLRTFYLDEGEELQGPFDYVELQAGPDDESIMAYELLL